MEMTNKKHLKSKKFELTHTWFFLWEKNTTILYFINIAINQNWHSYTDLYLELI